MAPEDNLGHGRQFWIVGNDKLGNWSDEETKWGLLSTANNRPRTYLFFNHGFGWNPAAVAIFLDGEWCRFGNVYRRSVSDKSITRNDKKVHIPGDSRKEPYQADLALFLTELSIRACALLHEPKRILLTLTTRRDWQIAQARRRRHRRCTLPRSATAATKSCTAR